MNTTFAACLSMPVWLALPSNAPAASSANQLSMLNTSPPAEYTLKAVSKRVQWLRMHTSMSSLYRRSWRKAFASTFAVGLRLGSMSSSNNRATAAATLGCPSAAWVALKCLAMARRTMHSMNSDLCRRCGWVAMPLSNMPCCTSFGPAGPLEALKMDSTSAGVQDGDLGSEMLQQCVNSRKSCMRMAMSSWDRWVGARAAKKMKQERTVWMCLRSSWRTCPSCRFTSGCLLIASPLCAAGFTVAAATACSKPPFWQMRCQSTSNCASNTSTVSKMSRASFSFARCWNRLCSRLHGLCPGTSDARVTCCFSASGAW
mmetsp:Transcript_3989/g.10755  ORF Transcript_3989/g.10755 Transcript_3989/m.10755 type:complete len:315 (-) Transcript_3989:118-1062(-)